MDGNTPAASMRPAIMLIISRYIFTPYPILKIPLNIIFM
jgi:hypothetical protein